MLYDDLSAVAICYELVLVGPFVNLVVAAASELLNSVLLAALSAAALFTEITFDVAFVIWVLVAASLFFCCDTTASELLLQLAAAAFSAFEGACTLMGEQLVSAFLAAELWGFGTTTLLPRRECHKALTSEAHSSPRVDVGDTPDSEIEHEGKSVKEPCFPVVFSVFVRSLFAGVGSHGGALGFLCTCSASLWKGRWWLVNSL